MLHKDDIFRVWLTWIAAATFGLAMLSGVASAEGDIENGRLLADTCKGCHAVDSYTNVYPTYRVPRIGGQSEEYLVSALKMYRSGERKHSTMIAQAASYSDQEIRDIAAWVASVVPPLQSGAARGEAPAAAQTCRSCHGDNGVGQISSYPYLAGQREDYVLESLRQYQRGDRKGPNAMVMQAQLLSLSDADLKAISAFYARQKGLQIIPMR